MEGEWKREHRKYRNNYKSVNLSRSQSTDRKVKARDTTSLFKNEAKNITAMEP